MRYEAELLVNAGEARQRLAISQDEEDVSGGVDGDEVSEIEKQGVDETRQTTDPRLEQMVAEVMEEDEVNISRAGSEAEVDVEASIERAGGEEEIGATPFQQQTGVYGPGGLRAPIANLLSRLPW